MNAEEIEKFKSTLNEPLYWLHGFAGFVDRNGCEVQAKPFGYLDIITARKEPDKRDGKYCITVKTTSMWLTEPEIEAIYGLGKIWNQDWSDIEANIEASQSGPPAANAYLLGAEHIYPVIKRVIYPVSFWKITSRSARKI
jgi:hypothetical protein